MTEKRQYRSLRDAFGQFATGVTVVSTVNKNGEPVGLTANSFASVSLEPPLVSWSIDKGASRFSDFVGAQYYTISVLSEEQQDLSNHFAMHSWDADAFSEIDWFEGHHGVPQLNNVSARFHCKLQNSFEGGDHIILLGLVESYDSEPQAPLIFFQGDYRALK